MTGGVETRPIGRGGQVGELIGWSRGDAKSQGLKSPVFGPIFLWEFEGFTLEDHPT